MHKKLMNIIYLHGTNIQRHQLLQTLRQNISDGFTRLNNNTWDIIAEIDTNKRPKTFFNAIKRMTGNAYNISPYIIHNEKKLYDQDNKNQYLEINGKTFSHQKTQTTTT